MKHRKLALIGSVILAAAMVTGAFAGEAETLKIGLVCPISGNSAIAGKYITHGVDTAQAELGGKVTAKDGTEYNLEFIPYSTRENYLKYTIDSYCNRLFCINYMPKTKTKVYNIRTKNTAF